MNRHYIEKNPPKGANADEADGKQGGKVFSIQLFSFKKLFMLAINLDNGECKLNCVKLQ